MTLREHINQAHNGNASEFARHQGTTKQQVNRWLNYQCIWHSGQVWKRQSNFKDDE